MYPCYGAMRRLPGQLGSASSAFAANRLHRVTRQCTRTGCSETAEVTLSYQYGQAQVWLDPLTAERDPHLYDMCGRHAGRLTAPQGWQVIDRRVPVGVPMHLIAV